MGHRERANNGISNKTCYFRCAILNTFCFWRRGRIGKCALNFSKSLITFPTFPKSPMSYQILYSLPCFFHFTKYWSRFLTSRFLTKRFISYSGVSSFFIRTDDGSLLSVRPNGSGVLKAGLNWTMEITEWIVITGGRLNSYTNLPIFFLLWTGRLAVDLIFCLEHRK